MISLDPDSVRVMGAWVLVKLDPRVKKTKGGIVLPGIVQMERVMEGTGVAVGIGTTQEDSRGKIPPTPLKKGDRMVFRGFLKDAAPLSNWGYDGDDFCFIHKRDIIGKIPEGLPIGMENV